MSTSKSAATATSSSSFAIVRKIAALLKLGSDGKLDSFLTKVLKQLKRELKAFESNLVTKESNYKDSLEDLNDKLEDAYEALESSYLNIDIEKISTNEQQSAYIDVYLENIDKHILTVKRIESQISTLTEVYEEEVKDINNNIASLKLRIENISKA